MRGWGTSCGGRVRPVGVGGSAELANRGGVVGQPGCGGRRGWMVVTAGLGGQEGRVLPLVQQKQQSREVVEGDTMAGGWWQRPTY